MNIFNRMKAFLMPSGGNIIGNTFNCKMLTALALTAAGSSFVTVQGCSPQTNLVSKPPTAEAAGLPVYVGTPATPTSYTPLLIPENTHLDANRNGAHEQTYNSDVTVNAGPLGNGNPSIVTRRIDPLVAACPTVLFDESNRLIATCITLGSTQLLLLDPFTLETLAIKKLPAKDVNLGGENNASGGAYIHLDSEGRVIVGPSDKHIQRYRIAEDNGDFSWVLDEDFDLSSLVPADVEITDTVVDYDGRMWFTSSTGLVGYLNESTTPFSLKTYDFTVKTQNQVAIDPTGVYVVTIESMNKLVVNPATGEIGLQWSTPYDNSGGLGTGGISKGSGTSPTLLGTEDDIVAITDNAADQLHINLYDRTTGDELCSHPIFEPGKGGAENSPSGYGDQIVISNNYGFPGFFGGGSPFDVENGLVKVEVNAARTACTTIWYNTDIKATPVPFFSTTTGLIYTYSLSAGTNQEQGWYLDLVDWDTGLTVNKTWVGNGPEFDNIIQQITITPDGGALISTRLGFAMVRDN
jgi:hypothetical protein